MSKELTELKEALTSLNLYLTELLLGMKKNTWKMVYYKEINFSVVCYIKIERKMLNVVNILIKNWIGLKSLVKRCYTLQEVRHCRDGSVFAVFAAQEILNSGL